MWNGQVNYQAILICAILSSCWLGCSPTKQIIVAPNDSSMIPPGVMEEMREMLHDLSAGKIMRTVLVKTGGLSMTVQVVREYRGGNIGFVKLDEPLKNGHIHNGHKYHTYAVHGEPVMLVLLDDHYNPPLYKQASESIPAGSQKPVAD